MYIFHFVFKFNSKNVYYDSIKIPIILKIFWGFNTVNKNDVFENFLEHSFENL